MWKEKIKHEKEKKKRYKKEKENKMHTQRERKNSIISVGDKPEILKLIFNTINCLMKQNNLSC